MSALIILLRRSIRCRSQVIPANAAEAKFPKLSIMTPNPKKKWTNHPKHNQTNKMKPKLNTTRRNSMCNPRILKPREFEALLRNATPKTLPAFVLGGFCGIRMGEIMNLEWKDVDFNRKVVTVYGEKYPSSKRLVSLPDAAAAWIKPIAKESGRVINLPNLGKLYTQMRMVWGETKSPSTLHSLRQAAISYRLALDGETKTAAEFGFSLKMLIYLFHKLVTKWQAKAWFAIFPPIQA